MVAQLRTKQALSNVAPVNVLVQTAAAGTAESFARSDHEHQVTTATAVTVGSANAEGAGTDLARASHTHIVDNLVMAGEAQGDVLIRGAAVWEVLPAGTSGEVLTTQGAAADPIWAAASAVAVTWKDSCRLATTGNIALTANQTIDGFLTVDGDRIAVIAQSTAADNGIYVADSGAWSRATDADTDAEVTCGLTTYVCEGTVNADKEFSLTTDDPITLGVTALVFANTSIPVGVALANITYFDGDVWTNLAPGADGTFLRNNTAGAPTWSTPATLTPRQEAITTETIVVDTALADTLDNTPVSDASVLLFLNGVQQIQGSDYTISGVTITWTPTGGSGTGVDMATTDSLIATYSS